MQLVAIKKLRYPFDGVTYQAGEQFEAKDRYAKILLLTGLAKVADPPAMKRKYKRRDMIAEDYGDL